MFLDEPQELSYLIGLCLAAFGLKVEHLRHIRVDEEVVTTANSVQSEPKAFDKIYHITELNISHRAPCQTRKQLFSVHSNPALKWIRRLFSPVTNLHSHLSVGATTLWLPSFQESDQPFTKLNAVFGLAFPDGDNIPS